MYERACAVLARRISFSADVDVARFAFEALERLIVDLARRYGCAGYCVTLHDNCLVARRHDGEIREFGNVAEFVRATHVARRRTA